jgi:ribosomal protein S18 acetylase RimI-like enzyme
LFSDQSKTPVGQVRIEKTAKETVIDISIDKSYRGLSLGPFMLEEACSDYLKKFPGEVIYSLVKKENIASYNIFKKVNFVDVTQMNFQGQEIYKLCRRN